MRVLLSKENCPLNSQVASLEVHREPLRIGNRNRRSVGNLSRVPPDGLGRRGATACRWIAKSADDSAGENPARAIAVRGPLVVHSVRVRLRAQRAGRMSRIRQTIQGTLEFR